ncbi:hypothetical protein GJ744_010055 [Endocarpon pusillum]|uniref:Uncharacterized protein n=1 Tax=Endocarpon pusillum TaxID=364733 RepID=A0A8H7AIX9_9EURO|nr:hypothetical protein GJ744_010055 [Endocarpon pusillum]
MVRTLHRDSFDTTSSKYELDHHEVFDCDWNGVSCSMIALHLVLRLEHMQHQLLADQPG